MSKIALITGGMGGIGSAICLELANAGYTIITTYSGNQQKSKKWHALMNANGHTKVYAYICDISDYQSCCSMYQQVKQHVGSVDILVNNAGITRDGIFKKLSKENWDKVIHTNLDSMFNVTKQVIDMMIEKGWGRIINVSSINGQKGQLGQTNYSASKAGIHGFTMALAQEVARKGITVNTIAPGYTATDMVMAVPEDIREKIIASIPVGRLGKPEEIAGLVRYLASDIASFITGAEIAINGGQFIM